MKKLILFSVIVLLTSCASVEKHNKHLETPIAPEKLRSDVDYAYKNLQKLHPNLYWYIPKNELDRKFDSLKATINQPINPSGFFEKLAPVIADVREAHLQLVAPFRKFTREETKNLKNQKGLFSRMNYVIDSNRIFVLDNAEKFENIKVGTEITQINDIPASVYLERYKPFVHSDGFNTTFQRYSMARRWANFFTVENGILDSVKIQTKLGNEIKDLYIHREKISKEEKKKEEEQNKKLTKSEKGKTKDYNIQTKSYNRDLQFPLKDSTVAYMKIKTFSGVFSKRFYKQRFETLKKSPAQYLILDVRDNLGGSLSEINNLYSYLVDTEFKFINDIEVTSAGSMFQANYFSGIPRIAVPIAVATYPIYLGITALSIKKSGGKTYLRNNGIFGLKKPKKDSFKGKIYVLINGSSFSAASILPSKLKADGRAILVGEETGGANDGTVAGRYSTKKLPHSKLKLPIGLMLIQPNIEFTGTKKGVTPHYEVIPTLEQVLQKKDIQLDWVMKDIEKNSVRMDLQAVPD